MYVGEREKWEEPCDEMDWRRGMWEEFHLNVLVRLLANTFYTVADKMQHKYYIVIKGNCVKSMI